MIKAKSIIKPWHKDSWRTQFYPQKVIYPNEAKLNEVLLRLNQAESIVKAEEIENLKSQLAKVSQGNGFILQGGDCAECLSGWSEANIINQVGLLAQLSSIIHDLTKREVITVGRIAGQYAKPRSIITETQAAHSLLSYRGDMINDIIFKPNARIPQPERLWQAYTTAIKSKAIIDNISAQTIYISHEALLLEYEQQFTRKLGGNWYNLSTHYPWFGMRTVSADSAHIEYARGLANPVAIKVGPTMQADDLARLVKLLNPHNEPGKLTLIHRLGAHAIEKVLPPLIRAVQATGINVLWVCDPMHGNTKKLGQQKTRYFDDILIELISAQKIHQQLRSYLGGAHLELTHFDVTECMGGIPGRAVTDLSPAFTSKVDPRLNAQQVIDLVNLFVSTENRKKSYAIY